MKPFTTYLLVLISYFSIGQDLSETLLNKVDYYHPSFTEYRLRFEIEKPHLDWRIMFNDTLNLVPNYSFELLDTNICPFRDSLPNGSGGYYYVDSTTRFAGWNLFRETPDLLNKCNEKNANWYLKGLGIPNNWVGHQYAESGNGYVGLIPYYEAVGIKLVKPLEANKKYFVGFKINQAAKTRYATSQQGLHFTTYVKNSNALNSEYNQQSLSTLFYSDSIIQDTLNWLPIIGTFVADSTFEYLYIGNFTNLFTPYIENSWWNSSIGGCGSCAYYYFDDIVVTEDSLYAYEVLTGVKPTNYDIRHTKDKINLYPNPTNGTVFINMPSTNKVHIYNMMGILTKELYLTQGEHEINISDFPSGVYLFRIGNESIKLVKE
jgi:hypothetical protein